MYLSFPLSLTESNMLISKFFFIGYGKYFVCDGFGSNKSLHVMIRHDGLLMQTAIDEFVVVF